MTVYNSHFNANGHGREFEILAPTTITTADVFQYDLFYIPFGVVGLTVIINVTSISSTPSVVFDIQGIDNTSGVTWEMLQSDPVTTTGTTILRVHPELPAVTNLIAQDSLPARVRIQATHANTNSITYSIGADLI